MKTWTCVLLVALVLLAACGGDGCSRESYLNKVEPLLERWDDAVEVANNTSRMSLAPQINNLQAIYREAEDLDVGGCAENAHDELLTYMDKQIQGFLAFLGQEDDAVVSRHFRLAQEYLEYWQEKVAEIE